MPTPPPNLLLISIDSWRHDAVPGRAQWRRTFPVRLHTPTLARLAGQGTLFTNLIVQAPFTPASHASFFTGTNPPVHGIRAFFGCRLADGVPTLAEALAAAGYRTHAIIGADALSARYGLDRGFAGYDADFDARLAVWKEGMHRRVGTEATQRALAWLGDSAESAPFFLFLHYFDAHLIAPHIHAQHDRVAAFLRRQRRNRRWRRRGRALFDRLDALYGRYTRGGLPFHVRRLNALDRQIGTVLDHLARTGRLDNTAVVIMSDHGDAFGEHGEWGHRERLFDTTLRVPLIIRPPQSRPQLRPRPELRRSEAVVRAVDVAPTVLGLLGVAPPPGAAFDGRSLMPLLAGAALPDAPAYAETRMEQSLEDLATLRSHLVALRSGRWKVIVDMLTDRQALYDVESDSAESRNVAAAHPDVADRLAAEALRIYHSGPQPAAVHDDRPADEQHAVEQRLRDLGYFS